MTETQIEKNFSSCQVLETKCGQCGLACSVAPVSEESGSYYCGRCRPEGSPHHPFEEAAKKVLFPCIFGCADVLAWGQAGCMKSFVKVDLLYALTPIVPLSTLFKIYMNI